MTTEFLKFYFVKPKAGIRNYVAKVVKGRGGREIYKKDNFFLYVGGKYELMINI